MTTSGYTNANRRCPRTLNINSRLQDDSSFQDASACYVPFCPESSAFSGPRASSDLSKDAGTMVSSATALALARLSSRQRRSWTEAVATTEVG